MNDKYFRPNFVYFISDKGYTKIGYSENPWQRLTSCQVGNPRRLILSHIIPCNTAREATRLEKYIHRFFEKYRRSGEWFKISFENIHQHLLSIEFEFTVKLLKERAESENIRMERSQAQKKQRYDQIQHELNQLRVVQ